MSAEDFALCDEFVQILKQKPSEKPTPFDIIYSETLGGKRIVNGKETGATVIGYLVNIAHRLRHDTSEKSHQITSAGNLTPAFAEGIDHVFSLSIYPEEVRSRAHRLIHDDLVDFFTQDTNFPWGRISVQNGSIMVQAPPQK